MPLSGGALGEELARQLAEVYADAEARLAADIARMLRADLDIPDWAERKLAELNKLRRAADTLVARLEADVSGAVEQLLVLAAVRGGQAALDELVAAGRLPADELPVERDALPGVEAVNRLVFSLVSLLRGTHVRILRWALDTYRTVVAEASTDALLGTATRAQVAQRAWERLIGQGVTGFVDRSGRRWELASYVEMATRTTVAQAATQAHLDRLGLGGIDLVIVSNAPQECERCRPWEGKVLAPKGPPGARTVEREHALDDGKTVRVRIAGSVVEAVAAGLLHPNCRHSLSAYLPGVTKPITDTEDVEGDEARRELRRLEREVRKAKRQAAAVIDPDRQRALNVKVRALQAEIAEHVEATGLHRQRRREQIGTAR